MMPVIFDIFENIESGLIKRIMDYCVSTFPNEISNLTNVVAEKVRDEWQVLALERSAWGSKYASAIKVEYASTGGMAKVYIDDAGVDPRSDKPFALFVNMTESGMKSFDIKVGLLASKRARVSMHGVKYIIVPFRWRIPGKQKPASGFAGVMPQNVYDMVKAGGTLKGSEFGVMAGLTKYNAPEGGHGQYFTFRCVTSKSKGWIHPGKAPTPVYPDVLDKVSEVISQYLDSYIKGKLKDIEQSFGK